MISTTDLARLEQLVSRLPFSLNDMPRANQVFREWIKYERNEDLYIVDVWTYCFVWRNLIVKFSRNPDLNKSDFDMLVARVYERIVERRYTVLDETRYTNWVSVICRNFFVNYLRTLKKNQSIDDLSDIADMEALDVTGELDDDLMVLREILLSAIARLPDYLQPVVRMRMLEQKSYDEISEVIDKKVEVVRSYFNKAIQKLRADKLLRKLIKREFREDIEG
ncbi:MAG: RNA polymerase sigma factor [Rhodothermales bacterium]